MFDYDKVHNAARSAQRTLWAMGSDAPSVTTWHPGIATLDTGKFHGPLTLDETIKADALSYAANLAKGLNA